MKVGPPADVGRVLDGMLAIKGALGAALVTSDGEVVAGRSDDPVWESRLSRLVVTSLASGRALGALLEEPGAAPSERDLEQVTMVLDGLPLVLVPTTDGRHSLVLSLDDTRALGRARLALRGSVLALADAALS